jgi:hypothetical protein
MVHGGLRSSTYRIHEHVIVFQWRINYLSRGNEQCLKALKVKLVPQDYLNVAVPFIWIEVGPYFNLERLGSLLFQELILKIFPILFLRLSKFPCRLESRILKNYLPECDIYPN